MIKLNRTTEYGLMALSYIRSKGAEERSSAREMATKLDLPFEIFAKTLQKLKERGVIDASYGTHGGYQLTKDLSTISLVSFLEIMEGPVAVVGCNPTCSDYSSPHSNSHSLSTETSDCSYSNHCNIKGSMGELNERIYEFLSRISVEELTRSRLNRKSGEGLTIHPLIEPLSVRPFGEEP